jgi:hypothetical protein
MIELTVFFILGLSLLFGGVLVACLSFLPGFRKYSVRAGVFLLSTIVMFVTLDQLAYSHLQSLSVSMTIRSDPFLRTLSSENPSYSQVLRDQVLVIYKGNSEEVIEEYALFVHILYPKYLPLASDEALGEWLRAVLLSAEALRERHPGICARYLSTIYEGRTAGIRRAELYRVSEDIVRSGLLNPAVVPSKAEFEQIIEPLASLYSEQQIGLLRKIETVASVQEHHAHCSMLIEYLSRLSELHPAKRAIALRYSASHKSWYPLAVQAN